MKVEKINQEIMKAFLKGQRVNYDIVDDKNIIITVDGYRAYILSTKEHCFNLDLFNKCNFKQCLTVTDNHKLAVKTDDLKRIESQKINIVCISDGITDVWVNEKYLSLFDGSVMFQIQGPLNPVLVFEYGKLKGLVMPVRPPKKED